MSTTESDVVALVLTEAEARLILALIHITGKIDLGGVPVGEQATVDQVMAQLREKTEAIIPMFDSDFWGEG